MLKLLNETLRQFIVAKHGHGGWSEIRSKGLQSPEHSLYLDTFEGESLPVVTEISGDILDLARETVIASSKILGQDENTGMEEFGRECFQLCLKQKHKILKSVGNTLCDFLNNVDNFYELFGSEDEYELIRPPTFHCTVQKDNQQLLLHYYSSRQGWESFIKGAVKCAAQLLFNSSVYIKVSDKGKHAAVQRNRKYSDDRTHTVFEIWQTCQGVKLNYSSTNSSQGVVSTDPNDLNISVLTLCTTFPFHIIFGKNLEIQQLGVLLFRLIGSTLVTRGKKIDTHFEIVRPAIAPEFSSILCRINSLFYMRLKPHMNSVEHKLMELKGQMIHLPEFDSILFLGSPMVESLEQLQGRGLFLSDIPIHDATRDLILVSEQALAQETLKKRMEQLKQQLQQTSEELAHEKRKTEEILESVFPHDIAKKLTHKQPVPARLIDNVTMLFSDIIGFTSICSRCAPMDVVEMLNSLYTKFDKLCGELDLYKVETIGDAYVVAGGLQGSSGTVDDARNVALMALGMIDAMKDEITPWGIQITIRVGIHTGSVLSGVVGTKMPRYCLFGHNVTVANKMESNSEASRINVSPVTVRFLSECSEFKFTPRPGHPLPGGSAVSEGTEVCHFLQHDITEDSMHEAQQPLNLQLDDNNNNNKNTEVECVVNHNNIDFNDCDLHRKCNNKISNSNTLNDVSAYIDDISNSDINPWIPFPCLAEQSNHNSNGDQREKAEARKLALLPQDTDQQNPKWHNPIMQHVKKHSILPRRGGDSCSAQKSFKETTV